MRLVLPRRRGMLAAAAILALALFAYLLASDGDAEARPAQHVGTVIPDGSYGVNKPATGEYVVFEVRNRRVRHLEFQIQILCQATDSPTEEPRFFGAGARAPQGRPVPANGKLTLNWQERADGRLGQITTDLKFGRRDLAEFAVIVPEETGPEAQPEEARESCSGLSTLHFRRGYEVPIPTTP